MDASAMPCVFTFRVLAHDHPIEIPRPLPSQWSRNARQNSRGANIRVLIKTLADRQAKSPKSDMIWYVRCTDSAEVNRIIGFELFKPGIIFP
jgi:hypothetical protein